MKLLQYSQQINVLTKPYSKPIGAILDYETLAWETELLFCKSLFEGSSRIITQGDIDSMDSRFFQIIGSLQEIRWSIVVDDELTQGQKTFLTNKIDALTIKFTLFRKALYIEAEKAWFDLSEETRTTLSQEIMLMEDTLYGPPISSIPYEVTAIKHHLSTLLTNNSSVLSSNDTETFSSFLDNLPTGEDMKTQIQSATGDRKNAIASIFDKEIPIGDMILIWNMVLEFYWLKNHYGIVTDDTATSISVSWEKQQITIPAKRKTVTILRVLELIDHEFNIHALRGYNTYITTKQSSDDYLPGEEGNALRAELLVSRNIHGLVIEPSIHHITTLIWELYDAGTTKKLLRIYFLLTGLSPEKASASADERTSRVKRFHSNFLPWANRKDIVYTRGAMDANSEAITNPSYADYFRRFMFAKFGPADMKLVDDLKSELWIKDQDLKLPVFLGRILFKKLSWDRIRREQVVQEDQRMGHAKVTWTQWKKLVAILNFIRGKI